MLIGPGQRGRWMVLLAFAVIVSVFEAAGTLLVFALLSLLVVGDGPVLPLVGDLRALGLGLAQTELMLALGVAVASFFLLRGVLVMSQAYIQYRVAEMTGARLSTRLLDGYLKMPYAFHLQRNSSELIRNAFDSVHRFVEEGLAPGVKVLSRLAMIAGVAAVLLVTNPLATAGALAVLGPGLWLVLRFVHPKVKELGRTAQEMTKANLQSLQQALQGIRDIVLLGREDAFVRTYGEDRMQLARSHYLRRTAAELPRVCIETSAVLFVVTLLGVAVLGGGTLAQAVPVIGLFGYAALRILPELNHLTMGLNSLKFVAPAIDHIVGDLEVFERERRPRSDSPLPLTEALTLENVSFSYATAAKPALAGVSFTVRAGESLGIVGPTGGGKTTLVDLMLGLLEPTEGRVTVDGVDIRERLQGWHANLGVVSQDVFLTDDTVRSNVALGVPDSAVDEDAVWEALRLAQLEKFLAGLPEGLNTRIGERGVRVSGGQRQRLAIARALYRRPDVLVFDEGTSALDTETEQALLAGLERLRGGRTLVTVAHRLSTVTSCDQVVLIRDGRIVDQGTFDGLVTRHASLRLGSGAL